MISCLKWHNDNKCYTVKTIHFDYINKSEAQEVR